MSEQPHNIAVEQPAEGDPEAATANAEAPETSTPVVAEAGAADSGTAATTAAEDPAETSTPAAEDIGVEGEAEEADAGAGAEAEGSQDEGDAGVDGADEADTDEDGDEDGADEADSDEDGDEDGDPLDTEGEIAADYLEELLDIADLDGDIDTYVESGRTHVSVVTDSQVLVGKDGEVLESLQDLVRLAVVAETGHRSRLMLDIAGHREKRRRELVDLATDAVQEARTSSEAVRLSPMNPFERKIVHDAVAAAGLTSESEGEEPQRRVVVMP